MTPEQKEFRIGYLAKMILYHKKKYYAGKALITDQAYDALEDALEKLDPTHPVLSLIGPGRGEFDDSND